MDCLCEQQQPYMYVRLRLLYIVWDIWTTMGYFCGDDSTWKLLALISLYISFHRTVWSNINVKTPLQNFSLIWGGDIFFYIHQICIKTRDVITVARNLKFSCITWYYSMYKLYLVDVSGSAMISSLILYWYDSFSEKHDTSIKTYFKDGSTV